MSLYAARLHLPGQRKIPSNVEVDVTAERVALTVGDRVLADWPIEDLDVVLQADGFHIRVDGEEMVLNVIDAAGLAEELDLSVRDPSAPKADEHNGAVLQLDSATTTRLRYEEVESRVSELAESLTSDEIQPKQVFSQWLKLLKEINRRHGEGSMPIHHFYDLNTQLLDLIPEPTPPQHRASHPKPRTVRSG